MRYLIALLFLVSPVLAADLTVTVPAAAVTEASAQCDRQRVLLRVRAADWNNDVCATVMVRLGIMASLTADKADDTSALVNAAQSSGNNAAQDALNAFDANFPLPVAPAVCGDSVVDTEFGETCDDGNVINGDGCDIDCIIEP